MFSLSKRDFNIIKSQIIYIRLDKEDFTKVNLLRRKYRVKSRSEVIRLILKKALVELNF